MSDFKAVTMFRMTADLEYLEVAPAGNIEHGTLSQEDYSIQAKTYARMLQLTRQDIINDDLSAFRAIPKRLGIGAAIAMNKVFWTAWLAAVDGATGGAGGRCFGRGRIIHDGDRQSPWQRGDELGLVHAFRRSAGRRNRRANSLRS